MKKIFYFFLLLWSCSGLLKSQTNCASSLPFCANQGAVTFPASTNTSSESGPDYGCLSSQPNPAWYYFQVSNSGSIVLSINGTSGADVDFICWGPFSSATGNCGNLTSGNTVDCSYSTSATETCTIPNGITGQYYQLLITNYANVNQNINFNQTGGTGSTNCGLLSSSVTSTTICQGGGPVTLTANSNLTGKTYTWNPGGQNTATVSVNPSTTTVYSVTIHGTTSSSTQTTVVETGTVTVNPNPTVTVPPSVAVCQGNSAVVNSTVSPAGTYTYNWSTGATTSSISTSSNGVVTVTVTNASTTCSSTASSNVTINPLPTLTMPGTQSLSCASPSATLIASASPSTCTPVWTGGVCAGANSYTATACTGGTYTLTVTNPATGCSNSGTVSVVPGSNVPTATASNSGSITCINTSVQVVATTTSTPVTYSWSGPGAVSGATTSTGTVTVGGTYTCVITNTTSGCSTTITANVPTNTTVPAASIAPPATITCASPTITLTGSPASGVTYTWTGAGIVSGTNGATADVNQAGIYTLSVTGTANGCASTATVSVANTSTPPALSLSSNSFTLTCTDPTATVAVTSTTTPLSYSWSPSPSAGGTTANPTFNAPGSYTVVATNNANGCTASTVVAVSSNTAAPTVAITPSQTLTCASPTAAINTTVTPSTGITYSWTTGATTSSVVASQGGSYAVTVTDAANGCTNTAVSNISSASGLPSVTLTTTPANDLLTCTHQTVTINAAGSPAGSLSYNWSTGSTSSSAATSNAGVVTVTVTNTASGCTITAQYTVTSNTTPPNLSASGGTISCASPSTNLQASSTNTNVTYSWIGPGVSSGSNTASPTVTAPGDYTVTVTDAATGCKSNSVVTVSQTSITAAFTANPTTGIAPLDVNFTNQSTGATGYVWVFGDGNGSTATNPSNTFTEPGTYVVTLVATAGSCHDTAQVTIIVEPAFSIQIPNVFTPNGDNKNDVFYIKSTGVKDLSLSIFNRWGEKLYDGSGVEASWNGQSPSGAKVPDGTYFFFVKATGFDGKEVEKHGTVSLYR